MFAVMAGPTAAAKPKGRKVLTCRTCKLKKCVGLCRWETVACPQPKGKIA